MKANSAVGFMGNPLSGPPTSSGISTFPGMIAGLQHLPVLVTPTLANIQTITNTITQAYNHESAHSHLASTISPNVMAFIQDQERPLPNDDRRRPDEVIRPRKRKAPCQDGVRYNCDECDRTYASHGNLKRHKKYECGQAPKFACPVCGLKFQHRHSMKIHCKNSHREYANDLSTMLENTSNKHTSHPTDVPITEVPNASPTPSPPLQIVDDVKTVPSYMYQIQRPDQKRQNEQNGNALGSHTIATAEVAVASVASEHERNFVALQRAQSQSSNTDV